LGNLGIAVKQAIHYRWLLWQTQLPLVGFVARTSHCATATCCTVAQLQVDGWSHGKWFDNRNAQGRWW